MSETSLQVYLNSTEAKEIYNNNTGECLFYLPTIEIDSQSQLHLCVKDLVIPYTFYNVNYNNNKLDFIYEGSTSMHTAHMQLGNYNINTFMTMLKNAMTYVTISEYGAITSHDNFTITYDSTVNKLSFQDKNFMNYTFLSTSTCFSLIGFLNKNYSSEHGYLKSSMCVNLNSIQCIHVEMNFNTNNISSCDLNNRNIVCSIPVDVPPYGIIIYKNNNFFINTYRNTLSEIQVTLLDQNGNTIYLNNAQWSMTLQLDVYKFA